MSRGERSFSATYHSQHSFQNLCIDTRSKTPSRCLQRELMSKTAYQSRHLPPDRVWLNNSKPKSATNKPLYKRISDLSICEKKRDCRVTSPFKHWLQNTSERKSKIPDPAGKLREEVIKNIERYQDLTILENSCSNEQISWASRKSKQGRLQPLLGRPRLSGPSINKCIGIQPRSRSPGTLPIPSLAIRERVYSSRTINTARTKPTTLIYSDKRVSEGEVIPSSNSRVDKGVQECPSANYPDDEQELPHNNTLDESDLPDSGLDLSDFTENNKNCKYCYRIIHFATYQPNSDDEDYTDLDQKMTVEIKQRLSSSLKPEVCESDLDSTAFSSPED